MHEVLVAGEGFRLSLQVAGYERPSLESGADANWIVGHVEMTADAGGSFRASRGVALRTEDLASFRDAVRQLVGELDGEATLHHMEDEVGCTIRLHRGTGELDAFVREHVLGVELRVERVRTDHSYLQETATNLMRLSLRFRSRATFSAERSVRGHSGTLAQASALPTD
jgi:hypothetical protein